MIHSTAIVDTKAELGSNVEIGPYAVIGDNVFISGSGFLPGSLLTISYDGEEVATTTADVNGIFVAPFEVPTSKHGEHIVSISDGTSIHTLTFNMESDPPVIPSPLLPQMNVEVESPMLFDWQDVTDVSLPVTYSLQISTIKDFSDVLLEKDGLEKSEYTLTEEEAQLLKDAEAPLYYWRARAIDGAENEGDWTGAGEFTVSLPFHLPSWALYTIIGLGGLILFGLGYWLGRRTAFYY